REAATAGGGRREGAVVGAAAAGGEGAECPNVSNLGRRSGGARLDGGQLAATIYKSVTIVRRGGGSRQKTVPTLPRILYFAVLLFLSAYGVHRSHLVYQCWRYRRRLERVASLGDPGPTEGWPSVTVQLPLFNEATVAVRLIEAVAGLDYPHDRLEIQV